MIVAGMHIGMEDFRLRVIKFTNTSHRREKTKEHLVLSTQHKVTGQKPQPGIFAEYPKAMGIAFLALYLVLQASILSCTLGQID